MSFGKVIIAAAGPGDPELITIKAVKALSQAEVILADRLASREIIAMYGSAEAVVVEVGKQGGRLNSTPQPSINELLVQYAREGKRVVRLKGGDVSVYANILDELLVLSKHQIPFEIIPGVTAALGAAAYAGIPLTARGYSTGLRILTYFHADVITDKEWNELATTRDTLIFYMSASSLADLSKNLIRYGMPEDMPLAIIEQATTPFQKVELHTIKTAGAVSVDLIQTPALMIIGKVVELHQQFNWFSPGQQTASYFSELPGQTVPPTKGHQKVSYLQNQPSNQNLRYDP
jgi:uroporphyrin-III C-methyltransferase/precorrin-2 dehydrogenase/sirohydrochlorin ferrochelatase/uroporphyrin-III C-methyltransferase